MPFKIERVWAYISADDEGEEGICAFSSTQGLTPMVCADEARVNALRPIAQKIARASGKKITLACFDVRADIEEILPKS